VVAAACMNQRKDGFVEWSFVEAEIKSWLHKMGISTDL
jgi:hypothetical protein